MAVIRRELKRGNKQKEDVGGRSRAQDGAGAACIVAFPPPLHASYLSGRVREAQQTVPPLPSPSTHLQLLQFPEAAEDLCDSLQTEVKSRKLILDSYSEHLLL